MKNKLEGMMERFGNIRGDHRDSVSYLLKKEKELSKISYALAKECSPSKLFLFCRLNTRDVGNLLDEEVSIAEDIGGFIWNEVEKSKENREELFDYAEYLKDTLDSCKELNLDPEKIYTSENLEWLIKHKEPSPEKDHKEFLEYIKREDKLFSFLRRGKRNKFRMGNLQNYFSNAHLLIRVLGEVKDTYSCAGESIDDKRRDLEKTKNSYKQLIKLGKISKPLKEIVHRIRGENKKLYIAVNTGVRDIRHMVKNLKVENNGRFYKMLEDKLP